MVATLTIAFVARGGTAAVSHWALAALLGAAVVALARRGVVGTTLRQPIVVAAALLATWSLARGAAAGGIGLGLGAAALLAATTATYLSVSSETGAGRRQLVDVVLVVGAALALTGWLGVALRWEPLAIPAAGLWRAATLLTYANAAAALLVMLSLVALARVIERPGVAGSLVAMVLLLGVMSTLSRAAVPALVVGLIVLATRLGPARVTGALMPAGIGAALGFGALLASVAESVPTQPVLSGAGLLLGGAATAFLATRLTRPSARQATAIGIAAAFAIVVIGVSTGGLDGRLSPVPADRLLRNEAAIELFASAPVAGIGPGPLWLTWEDAAGRVHGGWHAHNEYVELLAQLGLVGGLLFGGFVVSVVTRLRRSRLGTSLPAWAGTVAALSALAVHSAFDFLWHVPAIPLLAAAVLGVAAPSTTRRYET